MGFNGLIRGFSLLGGVGEDEIIDVDEIPTTGDEGVLYRVDDDITTYYYFLNGNRYILESSLFNPEAPGEGNPMGLLLAITYPATP